MFKMCQTSSSLRPALPLLMLAFFMLSVCPIGVKTYDLRTAREKRTPNENVDRYHSPHDAKMPEEAEELDAKLGDIFQTGNGTGLVLFNDTSQSQHKEVMFKVQRSPDGKLNVIFNDFLIFQTTTSATPTHSHKHKTQPNYNHKNNAIIFPDENIPNFYCNERREGKPYCTEVPNYVESAGLNDISPEIFEQFKSYFKDDMQPINVTQRMNSEAFEEYLCPSTSRLIYPKTAETKESNWLTVVQHAEYKQGILVELCEDEEKPCRFFETLPKSYQTRCKQNYIYRTVVVVVDKKLREEQVKMPSCCKCALRNTHFN